MPHHDTTNKHIKILACIAYDGSAFNGFARQIGYKSIEEKISKIFKSMGITEAFSFAGRTDKGVHARRQFICFDIADSRDLGHLRYIFNKKAYPHIVCRYLRVVSNDFHARFSAHSRTYRYITRPIRSSVFQSAYIGFDAFGDIEKIKEGLRLLVGVHDFGAFQKIDKFNINKSSVREIYYARARMVGDLLLISISANGFALTN